MVMTSADKLNYLNIGLMLISTIIAFILPFELFLFSYAVLGPLHYLTEVSWLQKSSFYIHSKLDPWILISFGMIATIAFFNEKIARMGTGELAVSLSFMSAFFMVFIKNKYIKFVAIGISVFIVLMVRDEVFYKLFFGVFLPTLIHVFVFTGLFIIYGALKTKSISGYISMLVFILCGSCFFWLGTDWVSILTIKGQKTYDMLLPQNDIMLKAFGVNGLHVTDPVRYSKEFLFHSEPGVMLMRFIAFAYTYHYLNWFSKTSVIKWHEIPKERMMIIAAIWVISVGAYIFNYKHGFKLLYFLSMVHVFLEFPLNFKSITGIGSEIASRIRLKTKTV